MRRLTAIPAAPRGVTLVELMVVLAIVSILAVAGLPAWADHVENARLREAANLIVTGTLLARSEALKRNAPVTVRVADQRLVVSADDGGGPVALRSMALPPMLDAGDFVATYDSRGRLAPFGTDIVVPVASTRRSCEGAIRCPAVHLEAGGAVAICRTGVCG